MRFNPFRPSKRPRPFVPKPKQDRLDVALKSVPAAMGVCGFVLGVLTLVDATLRNRDDAIRRKQEGLGYAAEAWKTLTHRDEGVRIDALIAAPEDIEGATKLVQRVRQTTTELEDVCLRREAAISIAADRPEEAREQLLKAQAINPDCPKVQDNLRSLNAWLENGRGDGGIYAQPPLMEPMMRPSLMMRPEIQPPVVRPDGRDRRPFLSVPKLAPPRR